MTARKNNAVRLGTESLETRELLSVTSAVMNNGVVTVWTDNTATKITVNPGSTANSVNIYQGTATLVGSYTNVTRVDLAGGAGNDTFVNNASGTYFRAWGYGGNDYLEGANGADYLVGGDGNDTLVGYGGIDYLYGQGGDDMIRGMDGDDNLYGEAGNDTVNGGAGADKLYGGDGDDTLVAIDNGYTDTVQGDAGKDALWIDGAAGSDTTVGVESTDKVQAVAAFSNGADSTLNGDNINDPTVATGVTYKKFTGPLFSGSGPGYAETRQGAIADCWLLSGLSAIALDNPTAIRQNMADFGDRTYGVRLGNNFYRVDSDLPVTSSGNLNYASLGTGGSMWVAIAEKAYAHYRTGANSYASLANGWGVEVNKAFGATSTVDNAISSYSSGTALGNAMYNAWLNYGAVTIGFTSVPAGVTLVSNHMYTVVDFTRDTAGNVTSVRLRNPWGFDGAGSSDSNVNDGLVTISVANLYSCGGRVNWGRV